MSKQFLKQKLKHQNVKHVFVSYVRPINTVLQVVFTIGLFNPFQFSVALQKPLENNRKPKDFLMFARSMVMQQWTEISLSFTSLKIEKKSIF